VTHFKFGGPIHVSYLAKARAVKFCTQMGYIKFYQKNEKSFQKGCGYGHVTYLNSQPHHYISEMAKARDFKFYTQFHHVTV